MMPQRCGVCGAQSKDPNEIIPIYKMYPTTTVQISRCRNCLTKPPTTEELNHVP